MNNRRKRRRNAARYRAAGLIFIALLIGVGIGILAGILVSRRVEEKEKEKEVETIVESSVSESVIPGPEPEPSLTPQEEQDLQEQLTAAEAYQRYLEEAAEEKSIKAGSVDFLEVAGEAYSTLFNSSYPRMKYNQQAFSPGEDGRMQYAGEDYVLRHGIDVSEFNGEVDWEKVKADGYDFVFIRLGYRGYGEGDMYEDAYFAQNLAGAKAAGMDVGVYFFAQAVSEEEAEEEARYVLDMLQGTELQMPVIYDVEPIRTDDARTDDVTGQQFTKNTAAFCRVIEENGYRAGYYANLKWEVFMLNMNDLKDYVVWYAGYAERPLTAYDFSIWQYSDQGDVDGIETNVDLDVEIIPAADAEKYGITKEEPKDGKTTEIPADEKNEKDEKAAEQTAQEETEKTGETPQETTEEKTEESAGEAAEKE